jgi:ribosome modulation factor
MGISSSNPDLFRAILAMDAYNRGYNAGIGAPETGLAGTQIGLASIGTASSSALNSAERNASFYAQSYTLNGKTVISYRGTDVRRGWTHPLRSAMNDGPNHRTSPRP